MNRDADYMIGAVHDVPSHYTNLQQCMSSAWSLLSRGTKDRKAPAHTPVLVSTGLDGAPQARTVVLRGCSPVDRMLSIHTDRRSAKVEELKADPRALLHVYDPHQKVQVRLGCQARLHFADREAIAAWSRTRAQSRYCYQINVAPGSLVEDPAMIVFDPSANAKGVNNFLLVQLRVLNMEWLYLNSRGHRRARFDWTDENLQACWLAP